MRCNSHRPVQQTIQRHAQWLGMLPLPDSRCAAWLVLMPKGNGSVDYTPHVAASGGTMVASLLSESNPRRQRGGAA
eukprot:8130594-Alexandrium_andersonii.AAC.1